MKGKRVISLVGLGLASIFVLALFSALFFLFGWKTIVGIPGTDSLSFLARMRFVADHFPNLPFWNYIEGAGVSGKYGYPILIHSLVVIIDRVSSLNLVEATKLLGFLSVPVFGTGLFLIGATRLKNPFIGFLAGVLYIISPISRALFFEWGFLAESVSMAIAPFIFLFYWSFLENYIVFGLVTRVRIYAVLTIVTMAIAFLAHPTVLFGTLFFIGLYTFIRSALLKNFSFAQFVKNMVLSLIIFLTTTGLVSFWFKPFYEYAQFAGSSDVGGSIRVDEYERNDLELFEVISINYVTDEMDPAYNFRNVSFHIGVTMLFGIGILVVWLYRKREEISFVLATVLVLLATVSTPFIILLVKLPFLAYFGSWRTLIYGVRIGFPLVAAYGAYKLPYALSFLFGSLRKKMPVKISFAILSSVFATGLSLYLFQAYINYPVFNRFQTLDFWSVRKDDPCGNPEDINIQLCASESMRTAFNITEFREGCALYEDRGGRVPALCTGAVDATTIGEVIQDCDSSSDQLFKESICVSRNASLVDQMMDRTAWNDILSQFRQDELAVFSPEDRETLSQIPNDAFIRYDSSPDAARFSIAGPYFTDTPQMTVYINQNSLVHRLWGYQVSNYYAEDPVYEDNTAINDIAQWFGISHTIVSKSTDRVGDLETGGYRFVNEDDNGYVVMKHESNTRTVEVSTKPRVLIVGRQNEPRIYEDLFKKLPFGFISYNDALIVRGRQNVDSYKLEDLQEYDLVIMHGYTYGSTDRAWDLLDEYISTGGSLFVETGWEYTAADYNVGEAGPFFPTTYLGWTNLGKTSDYSLSESLISSEEIDVNGFDPLIWNDLPWGVSAGSTLREWAKPILTAKGTPLIAGGEYGQGKVVWSGMNIFNHIEGYDSTNPETVMMNRVFEYLLPDSGRVFEFGRDYTVERESPDNVEFTFNTSIPDGSLYLKEAWHPRWRASQNGTNLEIQKAGPDFMLVQLSDISAGDTVVFEINTPFTDYLAWIVSIVTGLLLLLFLIKPSFMKRMKFPKLHLLDNFARNPFKSVLGENEDIDY